MADNTTNNGTSTATENLDQYELDLLKYTNMFKNSRYDRISKSSGKYDLTAITSNMHQLGNQGYRNYGTYRRDVFADASIVKINETYIKEQEILNNYYYTGFLKNPSIYLSSEKKAELDAIPGIDSDVTPISQYQFFLFDGVVLTKRFASNGNEACLEDIFTAYGYDYILAVDTSIRTHKNDEGNKSTKEPYFGVNPTTIDTGEEEDINGFIDYTYEILPIGSRFINEEGIEETVLYDGTYVPTVMELLDGSLYIVIKSRDVNENSTTDDDKYIDRINRIYFNNTYIPTLFFNDDKYPDYTYLNDSSIKLNTGEYRKLRNYYDITLSSNNTDLYILENSLAMKLCDIALFQKFGCYLKLNNMLYVGLIKDLLMKLNNGVDPTSPNGTISEGSVLLQIGPDNISFKLLTIVKYSHLNTAISPVGIITDYYKCTGDTDNSFASNFVYRHGDNFDYDNVYKVDTMLLPGVSSNVARINNFKSLSISVDIFYTLSMIIKDFSLTDGGGEQPDDDDYEPVFLIKVEDTPLPTKKFKPVFLVLKDDSGSGGGTLPTPTTTHYFMLPGSAESDIYKTYESYGFIFGQASSVTLNGTEHFTNSVFGIIPSNLVFVYTSPVGSFQLGAGNIVTTSTFDELEHVKWRESDAFIGKEIFNISEAWDPTQSISRNLKEGDTVSLYYNVNMIGYKIYSFTMDELLCGVFKKK